ncbi:LysM peptidoglycan-binding domain-containing protein [Labedella phragmitis]|uniref:LysM peptidoglycan-binding domain-containing protein n=2 Tax=Labedella phragmitis TaxID=2498849 RepID=A0A444PQK2_9MICO|nr:LysM peptidoglycan-binding domain-containing protein [Labedella phragmitis]
MPRIESPRAFARAAGAASGRRTATPSSRPRLRITRRGRLVLTSLVVSPLIALGIVAGVNATSAIATSEGAGSSASVVEFEYLTINAGESLWQVAERIAPASDPRDVIAEIVSLNQLTSSAVEPGQRLAIPSAYSGS